MQRIMLNGTVLIKRFDTESNFSGLDIPDIAQVKNNKGSIVAVCDGELELKIGDVVVFTKYGGTDIDIDGESFCSVNRKMVYWLERPDPVDRSTESDISRAV